jgi:hypothetical protein
VYPRYAVLLPGPPFLPDLVPLFPPIGLYTVGTFVERRAAMDMVHVPLVVCLGWPPGRCDAVWAARPSNGGHRQPATRLAGLARMLCSNRSLALTSAPCRAWTPG